NPAASNPPNVVAGGPSTAELEAAYLQAMQIWNDTSTFVFAANTGGGASDPCVAPSINPRSGVKFASSACGSDFGSTTLAFQQFWFSGDVRSKTGTVFNNNRAWDLYSGRWTGTPEFKRVAVHELGHGLGLDHSADSGAIMWFQAGHVEHPQDDDLQGVATRYDGDGDGVGLALDNCPDTPNPSQSDVDTDAQGDECDADIDADGVYNSAGADARYGLDTLSSSYYPFGPGSSSTSNHRAMTFPVAVTGRLSAVSLPVFCASGSLLVSIRTLNASAPSANVLASQSFDSPSPVPGSPAGGVPLAFTTPAMVSAGSSYALAVEASGDCGWTVSTVPDYAPGQGYFSVNGSRWFSTVDFPFQVIIDPAIVDNCPAVINQGQSDLDGDGRGDACDEDMDGDGLSNEDERTLHATNPLLADTDGDGLGDGDEVNEYASDPLLADTDGDGVNDGDEVLAGTDPTRAAGVVSVPALGTGMLVLMALLLLRMVRSYRSVAPGSSVHPDGSS
ncbi:MAG: matrixin family metalloprotease, partial [Gammaproteobacteria bacterium]|nr:matrixin family metalloprotease [Gammaproteobacteria bacterium]